MNHLFKDLFIFEMANNHQGSVEHGIKIIQNMGKIARKHGINAAMKLQYRQLDTFIHPEYKDRSDIKHISRFKETRLSKDDFYILVEEIRRQGMHTICTPFDEASVELCMDHGIEILKVASCSADDWPLLEKIAATKKPVIISTGGKDIYEIDNIYNFFIHRRLPDEFAFLHCVGLYPIPTDKLYLNYIDKLKKRYPNIVIGYSGHEDTNDTDIAKIAISKGAQILERHVGVETEEIKLNNYSLTPEQSELWVAAAIKAKEICGDIETGKRITQEELESLHSLKRGIYASKDIKKGERISRDMVFFAMPCLEGQTPSGEYSEEFIATKDYKVNEPIHERRNIDIIRKIRGIIHDVKGMLYEANVVLGDDFEIELSHHYGIEHFRQTGALIVNIINREYCKKIIVLLGGQYHPKHMHKKKEETFQVLWGDLEVNIGERSQILKPGDKALIERGTWHSFTTKNGVIFEEVSTTHYKNDSYYEDQSISRKDPLERKTILKEW